MHIDNRTTCIFCTIGRYHIANGLCRLKVVLYILLNGVLAGDVFPIFFLKKKKEKKLTNEL